jgi:hypothetical protein
MNFLFPSPPPLAKTIEQILAANPSATALYAELGEDPTLRQRSESLLAELRSLVRAEVSDFPAFYASVRAAAGRTPIAGKAFDIRNGTLLDALLATGDSESAVLELLNRNPVDEQIPFLEQVPLQRNGETIWVTPVEHPLIQKRASDTALFHRKLLELQSLYAVPRAARWDAPRSRILDAIQQLTRELQHARPYLPTALKVLISRVGTFEKESIEPAAIAAAETLTHLLLGCERLQDEEHSDRPTLRREAAELASSYLAVPRLHQPWLTSHILSALFSPGVWEVVRWPGFGLAKQASLIRNELRNGSYDPTELATRVRHLESKGLYVCSLVFPLLHLHRKPTGGPSKAASVNP